MREIKVLKWKEITAQGDKDVNTLDIIKILLNNRSPTKIRNGLDQHRFFRRVDVACEEARKNDILKLQEMDFSQIKTIIEEEVPASWGMNPDISNAIEEFLNSEQVK